MSGSKRRRYIMNKLMRLNLALLFLATCSPALPGGYPDTLDPLQDASVLDSEVIDAITIADASWGALVPLADAEVWYDAEYCSDAKGKSKKSKKSKKKSRSKD